MKIYPVDNPQTELISLLLLADPSMDAINEYLYESQLLVAEVDGHLAGIIALQKCSDKRLEIMNLAVDEHYQRQGIGRKLIDAGLEFVKNAGCQSVKIATGNSSLHQLKLYQSCGFVIDQILENYFIEHYPQPIYEDGRQCTDRIELLYRLPLKG